MTPLMYGGFGAMKAMCTKYNDDPKKASRPFDADRAGFVMGEGAGVVVLENADHAAKRGARVYAELAGYGATCDAHHITTPAPEGAGLAKCLTKALESAGVAPSEVAYVNAHGTSTAYNDKFETMALKTVFGDHAYDLAVSSTKGATGHTLGAAGGIEAVLTCLAVARDTCPPTINLETPDPDCDLDYVANRVAIKRDRSRRRRGPRAHRTIRVVAAATMRPSLQRSPPVLWPGPYGGFDAGRKRRLAPRRRRRYHREPRIWRPQRGAGVQEGRRVI